MDRALRGDAFSKLRRTVTAGLEGRVLEIGFGSGLNLPHYPEAVENVLAVDPSRVARKLAAPRIAASPAWIEFVELAKVPSGSVDGALSTWSLCSIPDLAGLFADLRRVLVPGGALHFLEHGLDPDPRTARWQRRLTPIQRRLAGGCRLDVLIDERIREVGFQLVTLDHPALEGAPRLARRQYRGVAKP